MSSAFLLFGTGMAESAHEPYEGHEKPGYGSFLYRR